MSNRRKTGKQRQQRSSRLKDHKRAGKILKPPMNTIGNMTMVPWLRDSFPNMIWLCALIKLYGDKPGMMLAGQVLDRIDDVLGHAPGEGQDDPNRNILTGEMTAFDQVPEDKRSEVLAALQDDGLYERAFPWILVRGLQKYDQLPGSWLLGGWSGREPIIGADEPETFLRTIVTDANHGQSSTATKAKAMLLRAWLRAGKISLPREIGEEWGAILPRYPDQITEEERRRIEPSIRAAVMGFSAIDHKEDESGDPAPIQWAKQFWRQNWQLYPCVLGSEDSPDETGDNPEGVRAARKRWQQEVDALVERFLSASTAVDPDLYSPDRHEVLSGLVYRQLRAVRVMVEFPALWTMEHGSAAIRGVLEARIVVKWLMKQNDPDLYTRFKDYGRGRLKLLKLHLEEYRDTLENPPSDLEDQIEYMDALVNRDLMEEFQDISVEGSFAGIDTRRMAEQVGLITDYRLVFQPASANVHGEWAALDQYILTTCRNPLHRWHRIPNPDPMLRLGPDVVELALDMVEALVADFESGS